MDCEYPGSGVSGQGVYILSSWTVNSELLQNLFLASASSFPASTLLLSILEQKVSSEGGGWREVG